MKESVTYQAILSEGKAQGQAEEARKIVLLIGRTRFGEPASEVVAALETLTELTRLEELALRSIQVSSWRELLDLNAARRSSPQAEEDVFDLGSCHPASERSVLALIEESEIYQIVLHKGKVREARKMLLLVGRSLFGEPPLQVVTAFDALADVSRLEELAVGLLRTSGWQELLALNGWGRSSLQAEQNGVPLVNCHSSLWQAVINLEESVTYQAILSKGKTNEARKLLLLLGRTRFGKPPPAAVAALEALTDVSRLEELGGRLLNSSSWQELLDLNG